MSRLTLEQRVGVLEQEMADLKTNNGNGSASKDWRRTVGKFPGMQEVFAEAMKLREADRRKFRGKTKKGIRAKS